MQTVTSKDGTTIAYDEVGTGYPLVLVGGAMGQRSHFGDWGLVGLLASNFTVYNYDRRGRGDSGDTAPYAVEREIEDIEAVIKAAGGSAYVYGISSGAILALEASEQLTAKVKKLALYEPPFILDNSRPRLPADYVTHLDELVASGKRSEAVEYFLTAAIGVPAEYIGPMKQGDDWAGMERIAHTIAYDGRIVGDTMSGRPLQPGRWAGVTMPTLVMNGGNSEQFFHDGASTLTKMLPRAEHLVVEGQDHAVQPAALAPILIEFYNR